MAAEEEVKFYRHYVKVSVAALCSSVGWHGISTGACDVLTDVAVRYFHALGRTTAQFTAHGMNLHRNILIHNMAMRFKH